MAFTTVGTMYIDDSDSGARFSDDRIYRYSLWRRWVPACDISRMCVFVGLNPSTADENLNDPTIRRCIQFSKDWGFDGLVMLNIFAIRATDPEVMKAAADPVGFANNNYLHEISRNAGRVVAAWGNHGSNRARSSQVKRLLGEIEIMCFKVTGKGEPNHPLYMKADAVPVVFRRSYLRDTV